MALHVKICGITTPEDALAAVEAGADALGLVFAPSSRHVTLEQARAIAAVAPRTVELVGVFVDETEAMIREAVAETPLNAVQFHRRPGAQWLAAARTNGLEAFVGRKVRVVQAYRARDAASLREELSDLPPGVDQILLDAFVPGADGGTGKTFDWQLVRVAKEYGKPVIVAGGLNAANVAEAIRLTAPWGVDVSSGVESSPGRKDHEAVRRFVMNARLAVPQ